MPKARTRRSRTSTRWPAAPVTTAPRQTKGPLVIPAAAPEPRRARAVPGRQEGAAGKSGLPAEENDADVKKAEEQIGFGLTVRERKAAGERGRRGGDADADGEGAGPAPAAAAAPPPTEDDRGAERAARRPRRRRAHDPVVALPEPPRRGRSTVPPRSTPRAQDAPTLVDYLAVPAEDFGAACLRGMGWRDTDTIHGDAPGRGREEEAAYRSSGGRRCWASWRSRGGAALGVELGEWGGRSQGEGGQGGGVQSVGVADQEVGGEVDGAGAAGEDRRAVEGEGVGAIRLSVDE